MSESKHTPGPWQVEYGKHGWPRGVFAPHDMDVPGGVGNIVRWNGIGLPSSPTALANARLIAAAPDLLFAAKIVLADLNLRIDEASKQNDAVPIFAGIASLHAAIAKAEGAP